MKAKIEVYIREDQMRQRIGRLIALRCLKKKLSEGRVWEASRRWCNAKNNCHVCNQKHPHECPFCGECAYLIEDGDTMACGMYDREVRAFVEKKK